MTDSTVVKMEIDHTNFGMAYEYLVTSSDLKNLGKKRRWVQKITDNFGIAGENKIKEQVEAGDEKGRST